MMNGLLLMVLYMKDLKLLVLPENNIYEERLKSVLDELAEPDDEYETIDGILCALYNFFLELDYQEADLIQHDITKLRGAIESFYDNL